MNGLSAVGHLNRFSGFSQLKDLAVDGSSMFVNSDEPAQALPFCDRWKQSNDNSESRI
jgi:hypothetical protein